MPDLKSATWLAVLLLGVICYPVRAAEEAGAGDDSFTKSVAPLITSKCLSCHSGGDAKGGLDLTVREKLLTGGDSGPALVPGEISKSSLWQRISADEMPPKRPLNDREKEVVRNWIESGANWSGGELDPLKSSSDQRAGFDWWSLQPLTLTAIPALKPPTSGAPSVQSNNPIDAFVVSQLHSRGMSQSEPADRRVLIRRLSFDLLGLPPTPEEIHEFTNDDREDAVERLIDRLLASPHYGERWARHWLDVVRFGESNGFERDLPRPNAWPYRDWVIGAFNWDLPYDEFVRWQIAGDLIAPNDVQGLRAVGFMVAGAHDTVVPAVDRMRAAMRQDELEDSVGVIGQTFLGLTTNCARCHDHKFDPITLSEYYQIASAISGVDHGEREFIPSDVTERLNQWSARTQQLQKQLLDQETPIREAILADRAASNDKGDVKRPRLAPPVAAWDFTQDLMDQMGRMHGKIVGDAKLEKDGLIVDGKSFVMTAPLAGDLFEKTLEVRVRLKTRQQSGGGVISLQSSDGHVFDAIVYAELEPNRWMAGSNGFQRTSSFNGPTEERADAEFVTITQVYRADGSIIGYRNGQPYGEPIRKDAAVRFQAGKAQILFGLRHGTDPGGNRMLSATISGARLYDRALSADEVAISADTSNTFITETDIAAKLNPDERALRTARQQELADLRTKHADLTRIGPIKIYTATINNVPAMRIHKRGSVSMLGDIVAPAGLKSIQGLDANLGVKPDAIESHRRLKLAQWLTDPKNALFARVMTNRIWHYHFSAGIVDTPSDLGFNGGRPSHPELLEWLSANFIGQNQSPEFPHRYSIKRLHRWIASSATYRQSSKVREEYAKIDSSNRLLWRMNPHRLEAEAVRDAILKVAGQLNSEIGGKGYADTNSYFFKGTQFYDPIDPSGYVNHRRTVYRMWARGGRSPFLDTFDCPDPSTTAPTRSATVTPLQALSLLNHSFTLRMAEYFAQRLESEAGDSIESQIARAFKLLYGRAPAREEVELSSTFIKRRGLHAFCRAMWNSSEFLFVE